MPHTNPVLENGGLHHLALRTAHFDRTIAFYTDTLGCLVKNLWGEPGRRGVMMDVGDGNYIEVFERDEDPGEPAPPAEGRLLHLCLRCDNLDEVVERVRAAGATITVEPKDVPIQNVAEGQKPDIVLHLAFFEGPDGEIIELIQCKDL